VKYQEAVQLSQAETNAAIANLPSLAEVNATLTGTYKDNVLKTFTDRVCLVAFVFRARGHHWLDTYRELYSNIWNKCRYKPEQLEISFQEMATLALHAIFPTILDNFWKESADAQKCNGALIKRYDVAAAGTAGPHVLSQGVSDLLMIAPGAKEKLRDQMDYLDTVMVQYKSHRFNGSVNAKYYNAIRVEVDEKQLGAIAATLRAALQNLAQDSPLGDSPALRRIANNAPLTGAVIGKAISQIATRPEVVDPLMIDHDKPRGQV